MSRHVVETLTGSGTWVCPLGVTSVQVEAFGSGGGGSSFSSPPGRGCPGGNGGNYTRVNSYATVPGTGYTYAAPVGGASDAAGSTTTFDGTGVVSGSGGDAAFTGGIGNLPGIGSVLGGGGGGSATASGNGSNASGSNGGAGQGQGGAGGANASAGSNGANPGGGGGGSGRNATLGTGGTGGAGQVVLTYSAPVYLADVCDGLTVDINAFSAAGTLGVTLTASRAYLHTFKLSEADGFIVTVAPATKTLEPLTRGANQEDCRIILTFSRRVADTANATLDPLVKAIEILQEQFGKKHPVSTLTDVWVETAEIDPVYNLADLDQQQLFFAVMQVMVRVTQ